MNTPNLAKALCNAQAIMAGARRDKENPYFKSKYADLSSVIDALREPFAENGLSFTQMVELLDNGCMALRTRLMHESGESLDSVMLLPNTQKPHELGSGLTYYRRYALQAIAGLPSEDDDANGETVRQKSEELRIKQEERKAKVDLISEEEWLRLDTFLNGHDELRAKLRELCYVDDLRKITKAQFVICQKYATNWVNNQKAGEENKQGQDS